MSQERSICKRLRFWTFVTHAIFRWTNLLRCGRVSEECIGHVVLFYCWTSDVFSAFPIRQEQTNLSRDVCVLHPIVFTTVWSTPSPSPIWLGQLLSKLLKSFSWYVPSRMNLDLYDAVSSIALVRNSIPSRSHSRVSPCPSACVTQSLTCLRPCFPTYEAHIPACPKRDREWDNSFSFELHFSHVIRIPHSPFDAGELNSMRILTQVEANRGTLPSWCFSSQHMLLGPIPPQQHSSFFVHRTRASPSSLCLTQTFCRPRTSSPSVPHCGDVEQLKFNLVLCRSRDHCSLIVIAPSLDPFSNVTLFVHSNLTLFTYSFQQCAFSVTNSSAQIAVVSKLSSLTSVWLISKFLNHYAFLFCDTSSKVVRRSFLCHWCNTYRLSLCVYDAFGRSHWTGHSTLHQWSARLLQRRVDRTHISGSTWEVLVWRASRQVESRWIRSFGPFWTAIEPGAFQMSGHEKWIRVAIWRRSLITQTRRSARVV